jgi:hypothetical protein
VTVLESTEHLTGAVSHGRCLRPYRREEAMEVHLAAIETGKTERTIRNWCRDHGIGRRNLAGGPWSVSRVALAMFLDGNANALSAYLMGKRQSGLVRPYYERAGLGHLLDLPEFGGPRRQATAQAPTVTPAPPQTPDVITTSET